MTSVPRAFLASAFSELLGKTLLTVEKIQTTGFWINDPDIWPGQDVVKVSRVAVSEEGSCLS